MTAAPAAANDLWILADDLVASEDLASTLLAALGRPVPEAMTGRDLWTDPGPASIVFAIGYGEPWSRVLPNRDEGTLPDGGGWPQQIRVRTHRYRLDASTRIGGEHLDLNSLQEDLFLADRAIGATEGIDCAEDPGHASVRRQLFAELWHAADRASQKQILAQQADCSADSV